MRSSPGALACRIWSMGIEIGVEPPTGCDWLLMQLSSGK